MNAINISKVLRIVQKKVYYPLREITCYSYVHLSNANTLVNISGNKRRPHPRGGKICKHRGGEVKALRTAIISFCFLQVPNKVKFLI